MPVPALPVLTDDDDSMLSRKFGRETANYFSGSPLNRLSFLRDNNEFLQAAFAHPSTGFLLMNNLAPLVQKDDPSSLAFATTADVSPLTGGNPFGQSDDDMIKAFNSDETRPVVLFLGVDDRSRLPSNGASTTPFSYKTYVGTPYFAIDVTPRPGNVAEAAAAALVADVEARGRAFSGSARNMALEAGQAALYGHARAMIDWNARNPFCAQCGQRTLSLHAGTKRVCPPTDLAGGALKERLPCATRGTVSNLSFPRTDPTVIMAIVSADGSSVLLGRQRRWPRDWFSTLAGFQEPGESIEEAVRREVWEESGVRVGRVVLHSSQPWPFPASLMIGAIGQALPGEGENIFLGNDAELESARWVPLEEAREALVKGTSNLGEAPAEGYVEGALRLPPQTAIANRLITAVVEGWGFVAKI
ncbi:NUDIX hydrolase domain-like protein [Bombardia bombarda]|uniref:NAD(+) diphosphatase n=1 Tax=Bombardia bombarda TaxID=252184 RepID=A0AA39WTW2_9PEZI|nr:NUDIX hydrolase domain-like protein [Bombardia bombarda]